MRCVALRQGFVMRDAAIVFAIQYAYVCVMGLQSLAVNSGRYAQAAIQSLMLGTAGFFITSQIAKRGELGGATSIAYILAGPLGIITSMYLFQRWKR